MERLVSRMPIKNTDVESQIQKPIISVINTIIVGIKYGCGVMIATCVRNGFQTETSSIHRLHDNIYAAVTGVSQDSCSLVNLIRSKLEMQYMTTNYRRVPVRCANQMTKQLLYIQNGNINVNLLIAGVDKYGATMYSTRFDGSSDTAPFAAIGSGMFNAMTVLETRWCSDLDEATARDVICDAVICGMWPDIVCVNGQNVVCVRGQKVVCGKGQDEGPKISIQLCIMRNDYTVVNETIDLVEQVPRPTISRIVPKILHERVVIVESTAQSGSQQILVSEGCRIGNEKERIDEEGESKAQEEERSKEQKE